MLTTKRLKELLNYDPVTGIFTWAVRTSNRIRVGDVAGSKTNDGYMDVGVDGHRCLAHRLAWLYMTGSWPEFEIDHKNGVRHENRFDNLRDATKCINMQNVKKARADNRLGLLGVHSHQGRFRAQIKVSDKHLSLGMFSTPELAHAAYITAKRQYHDGNTL